MKRYIINALLFAGVSLFLSGCVHQGSSRERQQGTIVSEGNIWKSSDGGKTWEAKNNGAGINFPDLEVLDFAFHPSDENTALAGTRNGGLLKTENEGENWMRFANFPREKVYGVAFDPLAGNIIYASGVIKKRGKIFKSINGGETWEEIYTSAAEGPLVISLTVDSRNSQVVYATTSDNQIIKTSDGGKTWSNTFTASGPAIELAIDSRDSNLVYFLVSSGGVFRSRDAGHIFEDITKNIFSAGNGAKNIHVLMTDHENGNWLYAAGGNGIARSKNAGDTWERLDTLSRPESFPVKAFDVHPFNSNEMVYGAARAMYRSVDGGKSWATFQFDISRVASVVRYHPRNFSMVYLGFRENP